MIHVSSRRLLQTRGRYRYLNHLRSNTYILKSLQEKIDNPPSNSLPRHQLQCRLMSSEADITKNRWSVIPPAALVEMSVGAIYCYSMFQLPLSTLSGVVCPAPDDWTTSAIIPVFSMAAGGLGLASAGLGSWVDKVGPVKAGTIGR